MAPFNAIDRSIFLYISCDRIIAATTPPHAAILVLTTTIDIAEASAALPRASCDPPLNPNHPNQRIKVPRQAKGIFAPAIGVIFPSEPYLPALGPRIKHPVKAAHPPTE